MQTYRRVATGTDCCRFCRSHQRRCLGAWDRPRPDGRGAAVVKDVDHGRQGTIPKVAATMRINGKSERLEVDARVTLLDALRERLGLTGTKKRCDHAPSRPPPVLPHPRPTL